MRRAPSTQKETPAWRNMFLETPEFSKYVLQLVNLLCSF